VPFTPTRILDTRSGTGLSSAFNSHLARTFGVSGIGVLPSYATAITGNLTVTGQTGNGYLFIGPAATKRSHEFDLSTSLAAMTEPMG